MKIGFLILQREIKKSLNNIITSFNLLEFIKKIIGNYVVLNKRNLFLNKFL